MKDDQQVNAFLPAALEVQDSPPSPAGRWLLWVILGLFAAALLWASLGEVDIVVTARGRTIPNGQVKRVQAPELGTIAAILVIEGERVDAGQPLIRLDSTYADADSRQIREQLSDLAVHATWRGALEQWLADGWDVAPPVNIPRRFAADDQLKVTALYKQHRAEILAQLEVLSGELAANRVGQATLRAEQDRARATLLVLTERVRAYKTLVDQQYGARIQYLEMLQQQTELEHSIPVLASREAGLAKSAVVLAARINATVGEARRDNLMALAQIDAERGRLRSEARKARQHQRQLELLSPVAGTVQELAVHTRGGVVSPAQQLMKIVPDDAVIEVEAMLHNRDIGFVTEGQSAEVKVDTFNFTKYGLIEATVVDISDDAIEDPQLGWVFRMRLLLEKDWLAVDGRPVGLSPGMAITAEVKTGKRRLIEFFLSPLLRYKQESLRER